MCKITEKIFRLAQARHQQGKGKGKGEEMGGEGREGNERKMAGGGREEWKAWRGDRRGPPIYKLWLIAPLLVMTQHISLNQRRLI